MSMIYTYSQFTLIDFDRVWEKNILEFYNTIAFIREYRRREVEMKKKQMKHNG